MNNVYFVFIDHVYPIPTAKNDCYKQCFRDHSLSFQINMSRYDNKRSIKGRKQHSIPIVPKSQFDEVEHLQFSQWVVENEKIIDALEKSNVVPPSFSKTGKSSHIVENKEN